MTAPGRVGDNDGKVSVFLVSAYAGWRVSASGLSSFHDRHGEDDPPERLLQAIWWHQRLRRDGLVTADGRRVRVLHPGFWNREPGPDFRGAMLQFDDEPPVSGDVEVDLVSRGWRDHEHEINPAFRDVKLHVVWRPAPWTGGPPLLSVADRLDAPLAELASCLAGESAVEFPEAVLGQCCAPLRHLPAARIEELLRQAAAVRFRAKAGRLQARAREAGWEQALWEGLFRGLGYKHNVWPMQRIGELRERLGRDPEGRVEPLQARLLGVGGLLPRELPRGPSASALHVRALWDIWWRHRAELEDCALPRALWRFAGLRPSNRPERRLALAAHWLTAGTLPAGLEAWCASMIREPDLATSLNTILRVDLDPYWSWHWTLGGPRLRRPQPLLGQARLTDLAINVVLPWLWVRALEGRAEPLREELERRYFAWPPAEDNAVLRQARQRLLGTTSVRLLGSAAAQQGLMQVVRDFCEPSNALCNGCSFPDLVRHWQPD